MALKTFLEAQALKEADMTNNITLKTNRRYFIGGVCAALLPFIIGLVLLAIPIIAESDPSCTYRSFRLKNTSMVCGIYREFGPEFYWFVMLPIILSFIFVAPLVAVMSVSDLQKRVPFTWQDIFLTSIAKSSRANFWVAATYNIILIVIFIGTAIGMSGINGVLNTIIIAVFYVTLMQFGLWLCVTLPLAIICAGVFGLFAKPRDSA